MSRIYQFPQPISPFIHLFVPQKEINANPGSFGNRFQSNNLDYTELEEVHRRCA